MRASSRFAPAVTAALMASGLSTPALGSEDEDGSEGDEEAEEEGGSEDEGSGGSGSEVGSGDSGTTADEDAFDVTEAGVPVARGTPLAAAVPEDMRRAISLSLWLWCV
jgi:hypothetical protein